jgi:photoactive yellow protein
MLITKTLTSGVMSEPHGKGELNPVWVAFGIVARAARERAGLIQKDVENAGIISEVHLSRLENGESGTRRSTVKKLAKLYKWDIVEALNAAGWQPTPSELKEVGHNPPNPLPPNNEGRDLLSIYSSLHDDARQQVLAFARFVASQVKKDNVQVFRPRSSGAPRGRIKPQLVGALQKERPCVFCGKPLVGGLCDDCRRELIGNPKITRKKLDSLPYGAIYLDRDGLILGYNKEETNISHLPRYQNIDKNFFSEVAPCREVQQLHTYYDAFLRNEGPAGEFDMKFPFDKGKRTVRVLVSFVRVNEDRAIVIVKKYEVGEMRDEDVS